MVVVNPFDLLDLGDESYDNDEVLFREAEKKALEDKKANEAAKEVARFAALRAAAEKEDRDRADAKERERREKKKAKWKAAKEEEKKEKELSQSQSPSEKGSETSSHNDEVKVSRKDKVRKLTIKVFPGDCEKPKLPDPPARKKQVEPVNEARLPSRQSNPAPEENFEQTSEVEINGQNAYENGNAGYVNYERPFNRNRPSRRYRNAGVQDRKEEKIVFNAETEGSPMPEESPEKENSEAVASEENQVEVNAEKNEPSVVADAAEKSDADKKKEEQKKEEEVETMTYPEYLRIREEQRKKLPAKPTEERKVQLDSDLQKMKPLPLNKGDEEIFVKLGSEKAGNRKKATQASGKDAKEAQENGKGEKLVSTEAFFHFPQYKRPQRQFTEGDGGKVTVTNGNQSKGRWGDRMEGEESIGSQGRGNSQQYRAPNNENRANPPAARGGYGGQSLGYRAPYAGNQRRGSDGYPQSNGGARTPNVKSQKDFPSLSGNRVSLG